MMFLQILRQARKESLTEHNIKRSWEKTGLFPWDPEVIIGSLPTVILQREKEASEAIRPSSRPQSRPTTSRRPAPLIIETPTNVNAIKLVISAFDEIKSTLIGITSAQDQLLQNLQTVVQKLGSSATTAITETLLTQGVNKELIESADFQKNRKKASKREEDKISNARVLSLEMMDAAVAAKAAKKKAQEEEIAKEKRLKAQMKAWTTLYNHTLVQLRK
jgi:hypothetical protein